MSKTTMDRVVSQQNFPIYQEGQAPDDYYAEVEKVAAGLKRTGATHVMINHAVCSIPWVMDPENSYMQFMEYGYPMNQFVHTTYDKDIYYHKLMKANRDRLLSHAAMARKYGLRCYIMCVEPTFMQESLFQRYPHWRGPRVDNPSCSNKPLFAPCVQLPEVQDYYRQEIQGMLKLVPEIDEIHIFTNDTGAGFCYSSHLYAGSSGPVHCKACSPGKHAQGFCQALLEAGRELNPEFRVVMTSGLGPDEKSDFIEGATDGICSSVYGAFAWGGGLEAPWSTMAIGPKVFNNPVERQKVQDWAYADMRARVAPLKSAGAPVYVSYNPGYYLGDDPRPIETHRITCDYLEMGAQNIIGGSPQGEFSINGAVMRHAMANGRTDIDSLLSDIASAWVGDELAPSLVNAWEACDLASRERPMLGHLGHAVQFNSHVKHCPVVPDDSRLSEADLHYYMTAILKDQEKMELHAGGVWRIFHFAQEDIEAYVRQYDKVTLPEYSRALALIEDCLEKVDNDDAQRCLTEQQHVVSAYIHMHRYIRAWLLAAMHKHIHLTVPNDLPSFQEVLDEHIQLTGDRCPERIALMKAHRRDDFVQIDLTAYPFQHHLGTAGWQGAHES